MRPAIKLAWGFGATVATLAITATTSLAAGSIFNTGNNFTLVNTNTNVKTATVVNTNVANTSQWAVNVVGTGGNSASQNIGGGMVTSGPAVVGTSNSVHANSNITVIHF